MEIKLEFDDGHIQIISILSEFPKKPAILAVIHVTSDNGCKELQCVRHSNGWRMFGDFLHKEKTHEKLSNSPLQERSD